MENIPYPIRINRFLALKGYCTRRNADILIAAGKVRINGKRAQLGDKVEASDRVEVDERAVRKEQEQYVYVAYYKPRGVVTTNPEAGQRAIVDIVSIKPKVFPIGRLDKESEGLIILTNDGRLSERLLHPRFDHEKEYRVHVDKPVNNLFLKHIETGIRLEDGLTTKPAKVKQIKPTVISITLTEGKRHEIRRMAAAFGYAVLDLVRERIMNIRLTGLNPGEYRMLQGPELTKFLRSLGL